MLSFFRKLSVVLFTLVSFSFAQDVSLWIEGTSLNYDSSVDISFQGSRWRSLNAKADQSVTLYYRDTLLVGLNIQ